jgi:hypothetical protein
LLKQPAPARAAAGKSAAAAGDEATGDPGGPAAAQRARPPWLVSAAAWVALPLRTDRGRGLAASAYKPATGQPEWHSPAAAAVTAAGAVCSKVAGLPKVWCWSRELH